MKLPQAVVLLVALSAPAVEAQDWIEFELIEASALPIVRAKINGMGHQRLVLDVGFNDLLLDTLLVDGSGMKLVDNGETQEIEFYGRPEIVPVSYVQSLEIGEAKFQLVRTLLIDGEDGTGSGGIRSYGRVGRDILEPLRLTIHYPRRLMLLEPSPESEVPSGGATYSAQGRFIFVPVRLHKDDGYEDATFVLDPGSSGSVLDRDWAADTKLVADKKAPQTTIPKLEVGGFERENVPILLADMYARPYDGNPAGVIGADVLLTLSISYDFARDLVWLTELGDDAS